MVQEREMQLIGKLEPIFPRKYKKKWNKAKGPENLLDPEWQGKIPPLHRVAKHGKKRIFYFIFG
jgi:hypothetical protein